ncbi:A Q resistance [Ascoidea rubescens DSM 1968]|uniref:A Q resistance n=1 Tax=Ascoidea rubescens DSM 1968 TaxID=1344418 RepID=A0A1D2V9W8_9ASCO|nr:A Q resistance [Ascoidea rubescens DSM 1968]ODV58335.1 A Q resistance [Ascoidea rubescens DSM 1968]
MNDPKKLNNSTSSINSLVSSQLSINSSNSNNTANNVQLNQITPIYSNIEVPILNTSTKSLPISNSNNNNSNDITSPLTDEQNWQRFSSKRKKLFVFIAAISSFLSPMSSIATLPAVSFIASSFNTTGTVINLSNGLYCIMMAVSPCIWSPISDLYGRRFVFLICIFFYSISSILVAVSQNLTTFFVFRATTALFGTAFFSVGAQIIADVYPPTQRGTGMGWTLSGSQVGPAIGPVIGGLIITYTSWRVIFYMLTALGLIVFTLSFFYLEETSRQTKMQELILNLNSDRKFIWVWFNPFRILFSLKYPNLLFAGLSSSTLSFSMYCLLTPIRYIVEPIFNLHTPIYGALFYLAPGLGYFLGSFYGGKYADFMLKLYIKKKNKMVPEDRLRSVIIPFGLVMPSTMIIYGWALDFEKGGMALPIIMMFLNGFAQTCIFPSINTYCVDSMSKYTGGDGIGGNYCIRFIFSAVGTSITLPSINNIGVGWTCTMSAFVLLVGFLFIYLNILFGERLRIKYLKANGFDVVDE